GYSRTEIIEAAQTFPTDSAELVVRVASCDFAAIGVALDAGARAVIVPQIESAAEAQRAVEATFYPPIGRRSWGPLGPHVGRSDSHGGGGKPQYYLRGDDRVS